MKKSDLRNGMIVEFRDGKRAIVLNDYLLGLEMWFYLSYQYDDDLYYLDGEEKRLTESFDIVKVYKSDFSSLERLLLDKKLELLWEREEIDWSKVPIGTKILFSINGGKYVEGLFIKKDGNKFIVCDDMENKLFTSCNYCKLAEESKEKVSYKELLDEFNNYCDKYYNKNNSCVGCECYDGTNICRKEKIIDNRFTIIRK